MSAAIVSGIKAGKVHYRNTPKQPLALLTACQLDFDLVTFLRTTVATLAQCVEFPFLSGRALQLAGRSHPGATPTTHVNT
jgi:hypothetical protein